MIEATRFAYGADSIEVDGTHCNCPIVEAFDDVDEIGHGDETLSHIAGAFDRFLQKERHEKGVVAIDEAQDVWNHHVIPGLEGEARQKAVEVAERLGWL